MIPTSFITGVCLTAVLTLSGSAAAGNASVDVPKPGNIFVATYSGAVKVLHYNFDTGTGRFDMNDHNETTSCGVNPSWLNIDIANKGLYCLDEGWAGNGSLTTFTYADNGNLSPQGRPWIMSTGPVHMRFYNKNRGLVVARYGGPPDTGLPGGLMAFNVTNGTIQDGSGFKFPAVVPPGPGVQQNVGRAHSVFTDPTEKFVVVCDLGADTLIIYTVDNATQAPLFTWSFPLPKGTGPRFATFWSPVKPWVEGAPLFFYVIGELSNSLTMFNVTYPAGVLKLEQIAVGDIFGGQYSPAVLSNMRASQIRVSPDNKFILVSNRNDSTVNSAAMAQFGITKPTDSFSSFTTQENGILAWGSVLPSLGLFPRDFRFSRSGEYILVANQKSSAISIIRRDVTTGKFVGDAGYFWLNTTVNGTDLGVPSATWDLQ